MKATTGEIKLPINVQTLDTPGIAIDGKILTKKISAVNPNLTKYNVFDDNV